MSIAYLIPCFMHPEAGLFISSAEAAPRAKAPPVRAPKQPGLAKNDKASGIDSHLQLLDLRSTEPVAITTVADAHLSVEIQNPAGNPLLFRVVVDTPDQAWTITDGTRKIARIVRKGEKLEISWVAGAPADAECLRNVVLQITAGANKTSIALRTPGTIDAPPVDLSKAKWIIPNDEPLYGLAHKSLKVEAIGLVGNEPAVEAYYPADRRADFNKKVRVVVHNKPPHAGIQLSLMAADDRSSIKIEPLIIDFNDNSQSWTLNRVATISKTLVKTIRTQEVGIPAAQREIPALQQQLAALKRKYNPNDAYAFDIGISIGNLTESLASTQAQLAAWQAALPINRQRLVELKPLQDLCGKVHQKARISFRIFYLAEDHEVDVIWARPSDSSAGKNAALKVRSAESVQR